MSTKRSGKYNLRQGTRKNYNESTMALPSFAYEPTVYDRREREPKKVRMSKSKNKDKAPSVLPSSTGSKKSNSSNSQSDEKKNSDEAPTNAMLSALRPAIVTRIIDADAADLPAIANEIWNTNNNNNTNSTSNSNKNGHQTVHVHFNLGDRVNQVIKRDSKQGKKGSSDPKPRRKPCKELDEAIGFFLQKLSVEKELNGVKLDGSEISAQLWKIIHSEACLRAEYNKDKITWQEIKGKYNNVTCASGKGRYKRLSAIWVPYRIEIEAHCSKNVASTSLVYLYNHGLSVMIEKVCDTLTTIEYRKIFLDFNCCLYLNSQIQNHWKNY